MTEAEARKAAGRAMRWPAALEGEDARGWLYGPDDGLGGEDVTLALVDKATGQVDLVTMLDDLDRFGQMVESHSPEPLAH